MATFKWYGLAATTAFTKKWDYTNDSMKVMLVLASYTPDQDAHAYLSDVVPASNEIPAGNGYTQGGQAVANKALHYITADNNTLLCGDDMSWASANWTSGNGPRYAVLYDDTPATNATKPILGYIDFISEQNPAGVEFKLDFETVDTYNTLMKTNTS